MNITLIVICSAVGILLLLLYTLNQRRKAKERAEALARGEDVSGHDDHAESMVIWGQRWATPTTIVFSVNALLTMGGPSFQILFDSITQHKPIDFTRIAMLGTAFVIVVAMDLVLLNAAIKKRALTARGKKAGPGLNSMIFGISAIEAATFMYIAFKLENPPPPSHDPIGFFVVLFFIVVRAIAAPACAIYLGTLTKNAKTLADIAGIIMIKAGNRLARLMDDDAKYAFSVDQLVEIIAKSGEAYDADTPAEQARHFRNLASYFNESAAGNRSEKLASNAASLPGNPGAETPHQEASGDKRITESAPTTPPAKGETAGFPAPNDGARNPADASLAPGAEDGHNILPFPQQNVPVGNPLDGPRDTTGQNAPRTSAYGSAERPLRNHYMLPDGLTLESTMSTTAMQDFLGVNDQTFSRRWRDGTSKSPSGIALGVAPTTGESNSKLWRVIDLLYMYEQGVFDGLTTNVPDLIAEEEPAMNGNH